jgi:hypothetical protein
VSEKLQVSQWGNKVVTQLSEYLRTKDPSLKGYSRSSIYNMVSFFETYSSPQFVQLIQNLEFVQTKSAQSEDIDNQGIEIVQTNSGQFTTPVKISQILLGINWSMHSEILNKCKLIEQKIFYILYAQKEKLNYRELQRAIKSNAYTHVLKADNLHLI